MEHAAFAMLVLGVAFSAIGGTLYLLSHVKETKLAGATCCAAGSLLMLAPVFFTNWLYILVVIILVASVAAVIKEQKRMSKY